MAYNQYGQQPMYGQYNPLAPYQQRLDNMQQQWQQPQQPQSQQELHQSIVCRPVASVEEARAIQTEFNGTLMVLPDISHGMIHTKRLDFNTGSAVFNSYKLEQPTQPIQEVATPTIEYAPMSEIEALKTKVAELEVIISEKPKSKGVVEK